MSEQETLATEGRHIARYLMGCDPPEQLVERYAAANAVLFVAAPDPVDQRVLRFVRTHPWSLALLESALGLLRPHSLLRRKIVVMMAILETTPRFAEQFDPRSVGPWRSAIRVLALGLLSMAKIAAGVPLYAFVRAWR